MNRITKLFAEKRENIFSVYFTAGFPELNDTPVIIGELQKSGVDMIEIGIPFSDPLADGPTIQNSSEISLKNGMNLKFLFEQLKDIRSNLSSSGRQLPLVLMGYLNPILQFGIGDFCRKCRETGIDGTIIPDLPLEEFKDNYSKVFEKYGLKNILLITPQTSEKRIRMIDEISNGFIYAVSSASTTGKNLSLEKETQKYFSRIKSMKLKNPVMIGFGISGRQSFQTACKYASGAIIGSAFIKSMERGDDLKKTIKAFVGDIRV